MLKREVKDSAMSSDELNQMIAQLQSGLITEVEFVLRITADTVSFGTELVRFNSLDAEARDWKFTLDDFNVWRADTL